jgi:hypothetical protein
MWMGGVPPLGYQAQDRKLIIVDSEAEIVRFIFRRYAELGSVQLLKDVRSYLCPCIRVWISRHPRFSLLLLFAPKRGQIR